MTKHIPGPGLKPVSFILWSNRFLTDQARMLPQHRSPDYKLLGEVGELASAIGRMSLTSSPPVSDDMPVGITGQSVARVAGQVIRRMSRYVPALHDAPWADLCALSGREILLIARRGGSVADADTFAKLWVTLQDARAKWTRQERQLTAREARDVRTLLADVHDMLLALLHQEATRPVATVENRPCGEIPLHGKAPEPCVAGEQAMPAGEPIGPCPMTRLEDAERRLKELAEKFEEAKAETLQRLSEQALRRKEHQRLMNHRFEALMERLERLERADDKPRLEAPGANEAQVTGHDKCAAPPARAGETPSSLVRHIAENLAAEMRKRPGESVITIIDLGAVERSA